MIVRHQRASASNKGFRQLARYIQGRSEKPRATWFLAANLPGVSGPRDLELACRLVEAVHAQNTRAGKDRTYHLVISLHPEDRSLNGNELRRVVENLEALSAQGDFFCIGSAGFDVVAGAATPANVTLNCRKQCSVLICENREDDCRLIDLPDGTSCADGAGSCMGGSCAVPGI